MCWPALFWTGVGTAHPGRRPADPRRCRCSSPAASASPTAICSRLTGLPEIAEPEWNRDTAGPHGFWTTLTRPLRNGHYWTYLAARHDREPDRQHRDLHAHHGLAERQPRRAHLLVLGRLPARGGDGGEWGQYVAAALPWLFGGWSSWAVEVVLYLVAGIVFAITLPWAMGGFARLHHAIARGCSAAGRQRRPGRRGPGRGRRARRGRAGRETPRCGASSATSTTDRSSGSCACSSTSPLSSAARQRATRMPRPSSPAKRRCTPSPRSTSCAPSRAGVAPPLLQDRGLAAALAAVAAGSALPVARRHRPGRRRGRAARGRPHRLLRRRRAARPTPCKHSGRVRGDAQGVAAGRRRCARRCSTSGSSTTGAAERTSGPATAWRACATASPGLRGVLVVESPLGRSDHGRRPHPAGTARVRRAGPTPDPERLILRAMPAPRRCASCSSRTPCCCARGSCGSSTRPATSPPGRGATRTTSSSASATRRRMSRSSTCGCRRPSATRASAPRCRCAQSCPTLGILVLSQYVEGVYARELLAGGDGGVGYLLKDRVTSLDEFTDAVRRVHERGTVLDPLVVQGLLASAAGPARRAHAARARRARADGRGAQQREHRRAAVHRRRRRREERERDLREARARGVRRPSIGACSR